MAWDLRSIPMLKRLANAAALDLFDICFHVFVLVLIAPASLAYPFNTRSQSLTLASPTVVSQVNPANPGLVYPVYPTVCLSPSQRGPQLRPSDFPKIMSDCSWIINEYLLQQDSLLFQNLVFSWNGFMDQSGNRYHSRWQRGQCVIQVSCVGRDQTQMLQLFNIILAANKILKECMEDQQINDGGTVPIGFLNKSFYVSVLGVRGRDAVNNSNLSLLSNLDSFGLNLQRSLLPTKSNTESSIGHCDVDHSTIIAPDVGMEKRASDSQHGSSLSTITQSLEPGRAWSTLDLIVPSTNLLGSVRRPPPNHPVECFNPYSVRLKHVGKEDCEVVIDNIIMRFPNPMSPQTFGYGDSADIDLSLPENKHWIFGSCAIFVRNPIETRTDTFRMVDVAIAAHRIVTQCVIGARYQVGGTADVGRIADNFYVGVGGLLRTNTTDSSIPGISRGWNSLVT